MQGLRSFVRRQAKPADDVLYPFLPTEPPPAALAAAGGSFPDSPEKLSTEDLMKDIDTLPTLDELLASGKARREVFKGNALGDRFHWKTRALNGEFGSQRDTETNSEGSIEAVLLRFPASVTITAVGKLKEHPSFMLDVTRSIKGILEETATKAFVAATTTSTEREPSYSFLPTEPPPAALAAAGGSFPASNVDPSETDEGPSTNVRVEQTERSGGKFLSVKCTFTAIDESVPQFAREVLKQIPGSVMVF